MQFQLSKHSNQMGLVFYQQNYDIKKTLIIIKIIDHKFY